MNAGTAPASISCPTGAAGSENCLWLTRKPARNSGPAAASIELRPFLSRLTTGSWSGLTKVNSHWFHVRERGVFGAIFGILISLGVYFAFDWSSAILRAGQASGHKCANSLHVFGQHVVSPKV